MRCHPLMVLIFRTRFSMSPVPMAGVTQLFKMFSLQCPRGSWLMSWICFWWFVLRGCLPLLLHIWFLWEIYIHSGTWPYFFFCTFLQNSLCTFPCITLFNDLTSPVEYDWVLQTLVETVLSEQTKGFSPSFHYICRPVWCVFLGGVGRGGHVMCTSLRQF